MGAGCIFSPKRDPDIKPPDRPPTTFAPRDTPKNAILYLTQAWSARDSVRIDSVYAVEYAGTSSDLLDPNNPVELSFTKSDEVRVVSRMALDQSIQYAKMEFYSQNTWNEEHLLSDPADYRTVTVPFFKIEVIYVAAEDGWAVTSPTSGQTWLFNFTLRPTYPSWAAGKAVWEIVRWEEQRAKL